MMQDSCQRRRDDLPLSIVRVGFTCAPLRRLPLGSTLLEDLVQSLLLSHSGAPPAKPLPASAADAGGARRQRSYTEQMLAAPFEPSDAVRISLPPCSCSGDGCMLFDLDSCCAVASNREAMTTSFRKL